MLIPAITVEEKLNRQLQMHAFEDRIKYYNTSGQEKLKIDIKKNTWFRIQAASVGSEGEMLGFLEANTDRQTHSVTGMSVLRFPSDLSITFARDFYRYVDKLFTKWDFTKITWKGAAPNPACKMYRRFAEQNGGREVGHLKNHRPLPDGTKVDMRIFEILRDDYLQAQ